MALAIVGLLFALGSNAVAAPTAVGLGTAGSYAVLAGTGITNTGPTTITGDIGTFPNTSITGVTSLTLSGTNHAGDRVTQGAKTALVRAYTTAAGEGPTTAIPADLVGKTLKPGVYHSAAAIGLSGVLTLDAAGVEGLMGHGRLIGVQPYPRGRALVANAPETPVIHCGASSTSPDRPALPCRFDGEARPPVPTPTAPVNCGRILILHPRSAQTRSVLGNETSQGGFSSKKIFRTGLAS